MRWYSYRPAHAEERTVSWFAWWPVGCGGVEREWRWLETVTVLQRYEGYDAEAWENECFVDAVRAAGGE